MSSPYFSSKPYIYRGKVESNNDPEGLGRCRVRIPSIHGKLDYPVDALPWSRPLVLTPVRGGRGGVNIPDVGDIVWVLFEEGFKDYPVYFGGTYAKGELPVSTDKVYLYLEDGNSISYDRSGIFNINIGDKTIIVSESGIDIIGDVRISGKLLVSEYIKAVGDVQGGNISLTTHLHGGVESGPSMTTKPV